jgi:hypothetical protein
MDKDCTAAIAVRGEQIKTSGAEYLWFCRGIKPPPLPEKPVVTNTQRPLHRAAPTTRQRP